MKLLTKKKRKIAVLFTAGLGDTLLYVPLLKELKKKQFHITCIFYSKYNNDCLFDRYLADSKRFLPNRFSLFLYALFRIRHFSNIYISHFGNGKMTELFALICSKRITKTANPATNAALQKRIRPVVPVFSDAEQNLYLLYSKSNATIKNITDFYLPEPMYTNSQKGLTDNTNAVGYFILQVSAGNNSTPFKNWPLLNWLILTGRLCKTFPGYEFYIIGDATETTYIKDFEKLNYTNCKILIGKTTIQDIFNLTTGSCGYIGLDSGIMHIAVALQKKTLTLFGASNEKLYGYEYLNPENHKVIVSSLSCRPCSGWKNANTSRVTDPLKCPDFACLSSIGPDLVFTQIESHFNLTR